MSRHRAAFAATVTALLTLLLTACTDVPGPPTPTPVAAVVGQSGCNSTPQSGPDTFTDRVALTTSPDGLQVGDFKVGCGAPVNKGSTANVMYTGWLQADGTQFDSSRVSGQPFAVTNVGQAQVIQGWNEGLVGMRAGGKRRLVIPAALGYGTAGSPPKIPANATLVFDIEVLSVS